MTAEEYATRTIALANMGGKTLHEAITIIILEVMEAIKTRESSTMKRVEFSRSILSFLKKGSKGKGREAEACKILHDVLSDEDSMDCLVELLGDRIEPEEGDEALT